MNKFKVDDRVAFYTHTGRFVGVVRQVFGNNVVVDHHNEEGDVTNLHYKQVRKLKKSVVLLVRYIPVFERQYGYPVERLIESNGLYISKDVARGSFDEHNYANPTHLLKVKFTKLKGKGVV